MNDSMYQFWNDIKSILILPALAIMAAVDWMAQRRST